MIPPEWFLPCATAAAVFVAGLLFWALLRGHQSKRFRLLQDQIDSMKDVLVEQKHWSEKSTNLTIDGIEEVRTELTHHGKILERIKASSNVAQHLDILEKIILLAENLGEINKDTDAAVNRVVQEMRLVQPSKVGELQTQFKLQMEQTRKSLEKSIAEKVNQLIAQKNPDELAGSIIDSTRYALLVVGKTHQDNLNNYGKALIDDFSDKLQTVLIQVATQLQALKHKFDEAPLAFEKQDQKNILLLSEVQKTPVEGQSLSYERTREPISSESTTGLPAGRVSPTIEGSQEASS